jgi:hypothetical protein
MRLVFAMLADAAAMADGKLYVHGGGWSHLVVDAVPTTYPAFSLVFALEMDGEEPPGRQPLDFTISAGEAAVATVHGWVEMPDGQGPGAVTNQVTFTSVPFPQTGTYAVRIASGEQDLGGLDLHVHSREQPEGDDLTMRALAAARRARPASG